MDKTDINFTVVTIDGIYAALGLVVFLVLDMWAWIIPMVPHGH
jgi:hypothetical protein